ncbi:MAG: tRNA pseudouridine(38-40) synthase TruA [Erysipelotrichaceae bacterium]
MDKPLKRFLCTVMYKGSAYQGWQVQSEGVTIQGTIQAVLSRMHNREIIIHGSGRTDAGVHALGQTFHFESELDISLDKWILALNSQLPLDIRIIDCVEVLKPFHARFDAIGKQYLYLIYKQGLNPFVYDTHYCLNCTLNVDAMRKAMNVFIGTHDFTSFCSNPLSEMPNQVRTIHRFDLLEDETEFRFEIEGDGFLRYMVRMIIAAILDVGKGKLAIKDINRILLAKNKLIYSGSVDACGLYLAEVYYPESFYEE